MPTIELTRDDAGGFPFLSADLQALMTFPEDADQRSATRATLTLQRLADECTTGTLVLPVDLVRAVLSGQGMAGVVQRMQSKALHGQVAGRILRDVLTARRSGEGLTVNACLDRAVDELKRHTTFAGSSGTLSLRTAQTAWTQYRSVAHLWAASLHLLEAFGQDPFGQDAWKVAMHTRTADVIALGMDFLELAATTTNGAAQALIDPAIAWVPPPDLRLPAAAP